MRAGFPLVQFFVFASIVANHAGAAYSQENQASDTSQIDTPEAAASGSAQDGNVTVLDRLLVAAPLFGAPDTATRSVTVLTREDIEEQLPTARSLADLLGKTVPGLAPATGAFTNYGQTMRGRDLQIIIDGVPQKLTRNASRDLFNVDPTMIESIEVIHGGSALYGGGATGGIVYITTLQGGGEPRFTSRLTAGSSLTHPSKDGLFGGFSQSAQGTADNLSYAFAASGDLVGAVFDANGDRIAPEPSQGDLHDTASYDLMGRLGYEVDQHRFGMLVNFRNMDQDSDYASDPSVVALPPGSAYARAVPGLELDEQGSLRDLRATLDYANSDIFGGNLAAQLYARDYQTRFYPFDGRRIPTWNAIAQSIVDSRVYGGNATFDTPLPAPGWLNSAKLMWGTDFSLETTSMPVNLFDGDAYDASGGTVFEKVGTRVFMPETQHNQFALFAQLEVEATERLTLRGGLRQQWATAEVDDYITFGQGDRIADGDISYSEFLPNIGAVYSLTDGVKLYADYARSFELPDIGLQLRYAPAGFQLSSSNLEPVVTDSYELGLRFDFGDTTGGLAGFYSYSQLGQPRIEDFRLVQGRNPERIYGVELALDHTINTQWRVGGTFTWLEGEMEDTETGEWTALNGYRIPPVVVTGYAEYQPREWWKLRLQALYSGTRERAFEDGVGFGGRAVEDYLVVDAYSSFRLPAGKLEIGVENLFNANYAPVYSQLLRSGSNTSHLPAPGTTAKAVYTMNW